jgi:hypothetical protein
MGPYVYDMTSLLHSALCRVGQGSSEAVAKVESDAIGMRFIANPVGARPSPARLQPKRDAKVPETSPQLDVAIDLKFEVNATDRDNRLRRLTASSVGRCG